MNAWLTALLLLIVVIEGNKLAREHLVVRRDFSEDGLYALSPATRNILARLEDRLQVKAYFTGNIQVGEMEIAKARLEAQLAELAVLSRGKMGVDVIDPSVSTEAALEATSYGIQPRGIRSREQLTQVDQPVFLGVLLRYRGREAALPWVNPWSFESQFSSALYGLVRDRRTVVGWFGPPDPEPTDPVEYYGTFRRARQLLSAQHEVRIVEGLSSGTPVAEDVDVLFVVRPLELHPRAVFEIDQYVQRGGRLVVLYDQVLLNWATRQATVPVPSGMEHLLRAWGGPVTEQFVWDDPWKARHRWLSVTANPVDGQPPQTEARAVESPLVIDVRAEGLEDSLPPTASLQRVTFTYAQPIEPVTPPDGVERVDMVRSSGDAYRVRFQNHIVADEEAIRAQTESNYADSEGRSYALAVALQGRFPSIFAGTGAPQPRDAFQNGGGGETTNEEVLSAAEATQVVVFGDSDWVRDPDRVDPPLYPFLTAANQRLLLNVVDWLTLDDELIALRSRVPKDRPLTDFVAEELRERDLLNEELPDTQREFEETLRRRDDAVRAARARQWRHMLVPVLGTLALVLGFGLAWNLSQRRGKGGAA